MKKEFKKVFYNLSLKTILSCIIATTIIITNSVTAKAIENNNPSNTLSTIANTNNKQEFITDSTTKYYNTIRKIEKLSNFKFKIPDYSIEDYKVKNIVNRKLSAKDSLIEIFYEKGDESFLFIVSEQDPLESASIAESEQTNCTESITIESQKQPMKLGKVYGLNFILSTSLSSSQIQKDLKEGQKISKYYAWKDKGLYYSIQYNSLYKSNRITNESINISDDTIEKIVNSMKYPEEI